MGFFKQLFGLEKPGKKPRLQNELSAAGAVSLAAPRHETALQAALKADSGDNPYLNARREWLERYGDYIAQARNWRKAALVAIAACCLSVSGNVIQATQYKTIPYVISVDSLGNTHAAGVARSLQPGDVPREVIQAELANYISNWRSVTADADLQNRMLSRLIAFSSDNTQTILQAWFNDNNPYKRAASVLVSVELNGLPQPVSQNAWRVEWNEITRDRKGKLLEETKYESTVTVGIHPPSTEEEIIQNPLGIIVADVNFNRLLRQ